jgi:hypothetical protein
VRPRRQPRWPHDDRDLVAIYLVGLTDGSIRVGKSADPWNRLMGHRSRWRGQIAWCHLGPRACRGFAFDLERALIAEYARLGTRISRSERFDGIDRATALLALRAIEPPIRAYWASFDVRHRHAFPQLAFSACPEGSGVGQHRVMYGSH